MIPVGIWIRVSTEEQAQGESPETHRHRAELYCELHDLTPVEYYDLGVSGKSIIDHPEAQRMLRDIAAGRIKSLIFSRLARLARNTKELLEIAERFKVAGAALVSLGEKLDTSTPAGMLLFTVLGALAEWERAEIAARVAASVPIRAAQGKPLGGAPPWGLHWLADAQGSKSLQVDHAAAKIVQTIFHTFIEEAGNLMATCRRLNSMGITTRQGQKWRITTLTRLIDDPVFGGRRRANYCRSKGQRKSWELKDKKDWIWQDVPRVVSQEVWEHSQGMRAARRARLPAGNRVGLAPPRESKFIFGGLLQCGCHQKMYVYHVTKKAADPTYRCFACGKKVTESRLVAEFCDALKKFSVSREQIQAVSDTRESATDLRDRAKGLIREAKRTRDRRDKMIDLYSGDQGMKKKIMPELRSLTEQYAALENEAFRISELADQVQLHEAGYGYLLPAVIQVSEAWDEMTYDERKQIANALIDHIVYEDDETTFIFYWIPGLTPPCSPVGSGSHTGMDARLATDKPIFFSLTVPREHRFRHLGDRIRHARLRAGWLQKDLAEHLGVHEMTISHWEHGGVIAPQNHQRMMLWLDPAERPLRSDRESRPPGWRTY